MSNTLSFDQIVSAADEDYGHLTVEFGDGDRVVFRNALQLSREERAELSSTKDEADETVENDDVTDEDQVDVLGRMLRVTAEDKDAADRFLNAVGDNLAYLLVVFKTYNKGTQVGEA